MEPIVIGKRARASRRLDLAGWILFVAWVLLNYFIRPFPDGMGTVGVGAIVLCVAVARFILGGTISNFWMIIGIIFVAAGLGHLSGVDLPFLSIALILCGILMLVHNKARRH